MGIPSISSNVFVQSVSYSSINSEMIYVFLVDGVKFEFSGRLHSNSGIQGLEYSDELEAFLMSLMPIDPRVSKKAACSVMELCRRREFRISSDFGFIIIKRKMRHS